MQRAWDDEETGLPPRPQADEKTAADSPAAASFKRARSRSLPSGTTTRVSGGAMMRGSADVGSSAVTGLPSHGGAGVSRREPAWTDPTPTITPMRESEVMPERLPLRHATC